MSRIMPAMADGRCFTSYIASCHYDQQLQRKFQRFTEPDFRTFLQNNALRAQEETRKLHVCAFAFDTVNTGPKLMKQTYSSSLAPLSM
jgi:hypothetical protein